MGKVCQDKLNDGFEGKNQDWTSRGKRDRFLAEWQEVNCIWLLNWSPRSSDSRPIGDRVGVYDAKDSITDVAEFRAIEWSDSISVNWTEATGRLNRASLNCSAVIPIIWLLFQIQLCVINWWLEQITSNATSRSRSFFYRAVSQTCNGQCFRAII